MIKAIFFLYLCIKIVCSGIVKTIIPIKSRSQISNIIYFKENCIYRGCTKITICSFLFLKDQKRVKKKNGQKLSRI